MGKSAQQEHKLTLPALLPPALTLAVLFIGIALCATVGCDLFSVA